jgi:hypothetical protein
MKAKLWFLWCVALVLFVTVFVVPAHCFDSYRQSATLTGGVVTDNTTVTFTLRQGVPHTMYLYVPTIDSAAVALSCGVDGTTFGTMATNYSATALIDFTYAATTGGKVLKLPDISPCRLLKITLGAAQAANRTFVVFGN